MAIIISILALGIVLLTIYTFRFFAGSMSQKNESEHPPAQIEAEITVSEFNEILQEHEMAAKAPLENRISELESTLQAREQELQQLKKEKGL